MMTKEEALEAGSFHSDGCHIIVGPRGKTTGQCHAYRVTGQYQPRPRKGDWWIPIKHGMYGRSDRVTDWSIQYMHSASVCPMEYGWNDDTWVVVRLATETDTRVPLFGYRALHMHGFHLARMENGKAIVQPEVFDNWYDAFQLVRIAKRLKG